MNWLEPIRKAGKLMAGASLVLSLAPSNNALAERRPSYQCPPGYRQQAPSSPYYSAPSAPQPPGQAPLAPRPGQQPGQQRDPGTQQPGQQDQTGQQPQTQDQTQPQTQDQTQQPTDLSASNDSSRANPSPGMNTPQLGRLDQANRLNLFDNMSAAPTNRVWFGMQYSSGITTGIGPSDDLLHYFDDNALLLAPADRQDFLDEFSGLTAKQKQINYRVGAEVLLTCNTSIAVQGQYFTNETEDSDFGDDFSNPQIMIKHVLARDCDTVLSATFGITPETSVEEGDFNENTTKLYPGLLYYETLSPTLFTQGGFQFGIPVTEDQIYTFDWSVSLGYWLYRDCSLACGHCCCNQGQITGIIPQINLLGKHTLGDATRQNAFGFHSGFNDDPDGIGPLPVFNGALFVYTEPEHVLDLSIGTLVMIGCDVQVGVGYSVPITDDSTRENEFLSYVNYLF